jgi:hypothetical protein
MNFSINSFLLRKLGFPAEDGDDLLPPLLLVAGLGFV